MGWIEGNISQQLPPNSFIRDVTRLWELSSPVFFSGYIGFYLL